MGKRTYRKRPKLGHKLKAALQGIEVDIFGYEKNVTRNIIAYFNRLSKETRIEPSGIIVRIFMDGDTVRSRVYRNGRLAKEISITELICLFTSTDATGLPQLEQKVIQGIRTFITDFSKEHHISSEQLHICILSSDHKVWVKGAYRTRTIADISLGVLIKHFTQ